MAVGYKHLKITIMKRYLYILLAAIVALTACDTVNTEGNIDVDTDNITYVLGMAVPETTERGAQIYIVEPYIDVNGTRYDDAKVYLEYHKEGDEANIVRVNEYTHSESDNEILFTLENLMPATSYVGYIYLDGTPKYRCEKSKPFTFVTKEHIPTCEITCSSSVEAKGLKATLSLTDVDYLVDGEHVDIATVRVEYARQTSEPAEWTAIEVSGKQFVDRKEDIAIPAEGGDYLEENRNYIYRVTIVPANMGLETLTTDERSFKTAYAEVTAEISTPRLMLSSDSLTIEVESADVYYDGVYIAAYHYCDYYIYMREAGSKTWSDKMKAEPTINNGMRLTISTENLEKGAGYDFAGAVVAGAAQKVCLSNMAYITIPADETPIVPEPPVGGSSDTTTIAGTWHLTKWRDAEPSFEVYLSISEDGVVTLWQKLTSREWELYYSTVTFDNNTLWGEYTDGTSWGASYYVTIDGDTMEWIATADSTDISVYTRTTLPDGLPTAESLATRTSSSERFL